jgi:hypothetical protein
VCKTYAMRYIAKTILLVGLFGIMAPLVSGQTKYASIQRPPHDTADARAMRVWVPVESDARNIVTIKISNDSNRVVRTLVNRMLGRRYYNFYWDKRDDSARLVRPGRYTCKISAGSQVKYQEMYVKFNYFEERSQVIWPDSLRPKTVKFRLDEDSALVSIRVLTQLDNLVDSAVVDSIMPAGLHEWRWTPGGQPVKGRYNIELQVGDYVHQTFMYR